MELKKNNLSDTNVIIYNKSYYNFVDVTNPKDLDTSDNGLVKWYNTYGEVDRNTVKNIIFENNLNDFLLVLLFGAYSNKVIDIDNNLFVSIKVFREYKGDYISEKIAFILGKNYIWSIQEQQGDYFENIRSEIKEDIGLVRTKGADYLFFLILDSIVDNYKKTFTSFSEHDETFINILDEKITPAFISKIEKQKQELLKLKKASTLLRDTINKLLNINMNSFNGMYFEEIKDQINNIIGDIDFEIQMLESNINLTFSIQSHHLNEVMKTLTIFSIIFIPITFLAGVYGMNFENMPELKTQNGYFILLGVMLAITVFILLYFKKKRWY